MPKTLLLADDSVTIQKVVGISFANEDVVLLTVDNGDDAVTRAREAQPDLVLADIAMPGKDGYQVCAAIKGDPALRHVPVLLLSGTFESFDEARARDVGADGHITKPFEAQALVDRVNDLLARAEAQRAVPAADTTVLVSEGAPAGDAFDFFDEEFAEPAPAATASAASASRPAPAATTVLAEESSFAPAQAASEPLELEAAIEGELDTIEPLPMAAADEDRFGQTGGQATVLFEPTPPPVPSEAELARDFATTRSSFTMPAASGAATRLVEDAGSPAEGLDFGLDEAVDAAIATPLGRDATEEPVLGAMEDDPADDLFAREIESPPPTERATTPIVATAASPAPAASGGQLDALRSEIREQLEKVAWEAFGDLSERVVREAVSRVEAIAWEVIPQMAETLIREELRKLKSEE
jgi:CheY-like chemotaxis protein